MRKLIDTLAFVKPNTAPRGEWAEVWHCLGGRYGEYSIWIGKQDLKDDFHDIAKECFGKNLIAVVRVEKWEDNLVK